jgi:serine/threonine protein kinase
MIGKTISHYNITEKLGEGGMGIVYKAQDLKLDRFVALKFLPPHLISSDEEKQRFIHEAKAASSLDHNNICAIHEIDEAEDGQLFISMAYYEGETLDRKIKDKPLPIEEAINITIQIAHGLQKAHEKEIVHRDIKPANIMLTKEGVVKVLDFGLAKFSTQTKLTKEGTTLGTIAYMSTEQTRGEAVDHRSDIWSLGVIIYEMITGQLPFKGDYDQALMYGITNEQPKPLTGLRTGVPLELERIVNRCLSKDPQDRYQHADDLLSELNKLKKESKLKTIPTQTASSKNLFKPVFLPAAIVFIVMVVILLYLLIPLDKESAPEWENSIAVLPFDNISNDPEQEYFCAGMTEQIISSLARLPKLKVISRTSVMKYKDTDKTIPEIGKELNVTHVLEGSVRKFGDRIRVTAQLIGTKDDFHIWTENYDREYKELFDVQDEVSEAIASNLLEKTSVEKIARTKTKRPINIKAYEYFLQGKYFHYMQPKGTESKIKKKENLQKSEEMFKKAIELDPNFADSYAGLADVYNSIYNWFEMTDEERKNNISLQEKYLKTAFKLDSTSAEAHFVNFFLHDIKAKKHYAAEEYDKFEHEIDEQFKSLRKAIRINHNHSDAYHTLGYFYGTRGLDNLAVKCWTKSLELNPLYYNRYHFRGIEYFRIGNYRQAEADYLTVLEFNPNDFITLKELSRLLIAEKRYAEAEKILHRIEKAYPDRKINLEYALIYAARGDKEQALMTYIGRSVYLFSLLGMKSEAIEELSTWSSGRLRQISSRYYILKNNVFYNNLRSDPRFKEILAKHKEIYEENLENYGDIDI